jgi:hypothetical protein
MMNTTVVQGQWKEAEELEVQVMQTRKRVLGEEHPETLTTMRNLASTYKHNQPIMFYPGKLLDNRLRSFNTGSSGVWIGRDISQTQVYSLSIGGIN